MTGSRSYLLPDQGDPCRLIISKLLEGRALPSRQQICKAGFAQHNMRGSTCTFKVQATSLCSQFEAARPRKVARSHPSPPGISTKLDRFRKGPSEAIRRLFAASSTPAESSTEVSSSFAATQILPVRAEDGSLSAVPSEPGIYAFYNSDSELQYVGLSRKVRFQLDLQLTRGSSTQLTVLLLTEKHVQINSIWLRFACSHLCRSQTRWLDIPSSCLS